MKTAAQLIMRPLLALAFVLVLVPIGLLARAFGNPLGLRYEPKLKSYRTVRK
ncbi:MAG: hypothetical protein MUF34_00545 [Polyangiaceae bacterium]|jgi:hypothetical protein|nr:hypothetical protein [Polyangiaceae bacterium]